MYFYYLASLALLFSVAVAQECALFNNATLTQPSICNLGYNTSVSSATAANNLYQFFSTLSVLPSKKCSEEFTKYYCSVQYPLCNSDDTVQPACVAQCRATLMACQEESDIQIFEGTAFPLPTTSDCAGPAEPPACSLPTPNLDKFYTSNCKNYNISSYTLSNENEIVCRPLYQVYNLSADSYAEATLLVTNYRRVDGLASGEPDLNLYPCLKALSNYGCSLAMPPCNTDGALPLRDTCASVCHEVVTACANYLDNFVGSGLRIPTAAVCDASFPATNCFIPNANDTYVGFYFGGDPPPATQPTKAPGDEEPDDSNDIYPPRGAGVGGGIGAGVLVGLLLIIGLIMLVMKKQDSR